MKLALYFPIRTDAAISGHIIGYNNVLTNLREALLDAGVQFDEDYPVALHIAPPHLFRPMPGQWSAVYTMWEARDLPPRMARGVADADMLIVPSTFCKTVFARAGFHKPIVVVPLGIWAEQWEFPPPERPPVGMRTFLWLGSRDIRKGYPFMSEAWTRAFTMGDPAILTVKTSSDPGETRMRNLRYGRVQFLTHKMSWPELQSLYLGHEVYVNTSVGEGYGLIVLEAMAAGMLVITPRHTGLADFVHSGVAWMVETEKKSGHYGVPTVMPAPKVSHLTTLLRAAVTDYPKTAELRMRAAAQARTLSWQRCAEGVMQAITRYAGRRVA